METAWATLQIPKPRPPDVPAQAALPIPRPRPTERSLQKRVQASKDHQEKLTALNQLKWQMAELQEKANIAEWGELDAGNNASRAALSPIWPTDPQLPSELVQPTKAGPSSSMTTPQGSSQAPNSTAKPKTKISNMVAIPRTYRRDGRVVHSALGTRLEPGPSQTSATKRPPYSPLGPDPHQARAGAFATPTRPWLAIVLTTTRVGSAADQGIICGYRTQDPHLA